MDRLAQVMAGRRQKPCLGAVSTLGPVAFLLQVFDQPFVFQP